MAVIERLDRETGEFVREEFDVEVVDLADETPLQKGQRLANELRAAVDESRERRAEAQAAVVPDGVSGHVSPDPLKQVFPPTEQAFELEGIEFYESQDLDTLKNRLIAKWPEFHALRQCSIDILWKKSGGAGGGKLTFGKCSKMSGLARFYSREDFVIWIAADHVRDHNLTQHQLEALIYHELSHIGWELDKSGEVKWSVVAHDATVFFSEITRYGTWQQDLRVLKDRYEQMAMLEERA